MKESVFSEYPDVVNVDQLRKMLGGIGPKAAYQLLHDGNPVLQDRESVPNPEGECNPLPWRVVSVLKMFDGQNIVGGVVVAKIKLSLAGAAPLKGGKQRW